MVLVGNYATRVKFYNLSCLKVKHQKLMKYVRLKQKGFRNLKKNLFMSETVRACTFY